MSIGARERALGPVAVGLIRNADQIMNKPVSFSWAIENRGTKKNLSGSRRMGQHMNDNEIKAVHDLFEARAQEQPPQRRPAPSVVHSEVSRCMQKWNALARQRPDSLFYSEPTYYSPAKFPVVLGSLSHQSKQIQVVFENAPNSMRDVEGTARFGVE